MTFAYWENLTDLQRHTIQLLTGASLLEGATNFSDSANPLVGVFPGLARLNVHSHPSMTITVLMAALSTLPVLLAVWAIGRYLKREPDEFIRSLVVTALLWGVALMLVGDAVAGVFMEVYSRTFPLGALNGDVLILSSLTAFLLLLRGYR
jgi:hypothetical protein